MESGAKGATIIVSGKLRGQRAKSMKFTDGVMIFSGEGAHEYVTKATRHVLLRQGRIYFASKPKCNLIIKILLLHQEASCESRY